MLGNKTSSLLTKTDTEIINSICFLVSFTALICISMLAQQANVSQLMHSASVTPPHLPHPSPPLTYPPPLTLMPSPQLSLVHVREVATHRRIGCREPAHYPTPKRACHRGRRPDCYWPTLDTCSAHLQARAKVKQEQPGTAGVGEGGGSGAGQAG